MTTFTQTIVETFSVVNCATCGVRFAISGDLYRRVVTNAEGSIFCPSCGNKTMWRESDDQKKIKQLEQKLQWEAAQSARLKVESDRLKASRDAVKSSLQATKGVVTRMKRRVAAGTCPCCHRTFKQLTAHMANKHPDFVADNKIQL